jgi:phenylalanyl-tRNA synthetase alpha subunit
VAWLKSLQQLTFSFFVSVVSKNEYLMSNLKKHVETVLSHFCSYVRLQLNPLFPFSHPSEKVDSGCLSAWAENALSGVS